MRPGRPSWTRSSVGRQAGAQIPTACPLLRGPDPPGMGRVETPQSRVPEGPGTISQLEGGAGSAGQGEPRPGPPEERAPRWAPSLDRPLALPCTLGSSAVSPAPAGQPQGSTHHILPSASVPLGEAWGSGQIGVQGVEVATGLDTVSCTRWWEGLWALGKSRSGPLQGHLPRSTFLRPGA